MSFFSVSHWETTDWTAEMEALARDKYVPMVMALGAESVDMVRTGERNFIVVTKYADEAAASAAQAKIDAVRNEAAGELPMSMSSVERGSTFASG